MPFTIRPDGSITASSTAEALLLSRRIGPAKASAPEPDGPPIKPFPWTWDEIDSDLAAIRFASREAPAEAPPQPRPAPIASPEPPKQEQAPTPTAAVEKARHRLRVINGRVRSKTIAPGRMSREERVEGELLAYPLDVDRPMTRGDCAELPRPCPFVSCAHHLYLDANPETGALKLNFPHLDVWEMAETCSLDVADRGGVTLEELGAILNLTRERIRQVEVAGLYRIKMHTGGELGLPPDRDR